jgi:hypothetical protein
MFGIRALGPASALALLLSASCVDTPRQRFVPNALDPHEVGVALVASDSAPPSGTMVSVSVRLVASSSAPPRIGSYTARLVYDTLMLRYAGELTTSDGAARAINPQPGLVRSAGYAIDGISGAQLFGVVFESRRGGAGALRGVEVQLTELHSATHEDLRPRLRAVGLTTEPGLQP